MYFVVLNTSQRTTKMLKISEDGDGLYFAQFVEPIARPSATLLLAKYTWIFLLNLCLNTSVFRSVPTVYFEVLDSTHRTSKNAYNKRGWKRIVLCTISRSDRSYKLHAEKPTKF